MIVRKRMESQLYAYAYNKLNDVYTVRGISDEVCSFEPRSIYRIPTGLLEKMKSEYTVNSNNFSKSLNEQISFEQGGFRAIVDYHGRSFDSEQIRAIFNNKFVNVPYSSTNEIGKIISQHKKN